MSTSNSRYENSNNLQQIVEQSAERFNLDLNNPSAYLRIEDLAEPTLVIQRIDENLLAIGEYVSAPNLGQDPVGNPKFILFTRTDKWIPVGYECLEKGYQYGVFLAADNSEIVSVIPKVQVTIAEAAEGWARAMNDHDYSEAKATQHPLGIIKFEEESD